MLSSAQPAVLLYDDRRAIPPTKYLAQDEIILLLTPVVLPLDAEKNVSKDPFEPLGIAIYNRHQSVHHVPYTKHDGITEAIVQHIRIARIVVFVISGLPSHQEPSQFDFALEVAKGCETRPLIVLACCAFDRTSLPKHTFPTVVQVKHFLPPDLSAAAALIFGEHATPLTFTPSPPPALVMENPRKIRSFQLEEEKTFSYWVRLTVHPNLASL
jgi:hypothetical protein